jgi:hypothetical protein
MDGPSPMCVRGPGPFKSGSTNISARHVMYGGTAPRRPPPSCSAQARRLFCSSHLPPPPPVGAHWLIDRTAEPDMRIVGASHRCAASI